MHRIKVTIQRGGKAKIKVEGIAGSGCAVLTKNLEEALGKKVKDIKTSEYYQAENTQQVKQGL